ncbi:MAG: T9SS type A sorting domain-containing protein [Burkholderiales bacterium]|nr:T9SS type A sorting domain-containing protein [Flavobacterium sp.]
MKKNVLWSVAFLLCSLMVSAQQVTITPATFNVTDPITITVSFASATCNSMGANPVKVYMHAGIGNETNAFGYSVVGNWGTDDEVGAMNNNGNGTWSKTITPSTYFGLNATQQANASKMGMVFRNPTGTQTLKLAPSCGDFIFNVGYFQVSLNSPLANSSTIISSGGSLTIQASNTNGNATYNLLANGVSINTTSGTAVYNFPHNNITENQNYELLITQGTATQSRKFTAIVNPGTISQALPSGTLLEGINYNLGDASKATLVLDAPFKDFVYVAGSFNNWQPTAAYAMKKDPSSTKFWLELSGLTPGTDYSYQYWVVDTTPIANSPALVKTADPYSTLVLSPFDDPYIPASSYPNLPPYPTGQEREVTVLKTGTAPYNWQVTNFAKPKKEDLVVYEVLIRDFDSHRNFQDLIDRIDYFKNLKVNAIELMPVMEFEGNEGWGYNPSFHLALDKFYGPASKMKEFVDLCHQNGIAVILDIALNHAFGRNPLDRMWMNDPDGDGWGGPSTENPYFNVTSTHSYGVGNDFNHQQPRTKSYVKRVIKQWVEEFKIDGFRWDLTKGFTQNCTGSDACTNSYQQDRVDVLKDYADYSWSLDPYHYAIFEHLGADNEEQQWANYRISETPSKGVMMWGEMFTAYKQLELGYAANADITRMGNTAHGFTAKRLIGYPESHDKDRLMYEALNYGNTAGTAPPFNNLNNALARMSAIGAASILIPGPKMIWHFADLGMDDSIYTCTDGSVNSETDAATGDCKLDTKPQPQWTDNWLAVPQRVQIYNDWARFIALKTTEPVFEGNYTISPNGSNLKQRIYIYDSSLPVNQIQNVVVLANFSVSALNITPDFPYAGVWYNLMNNTPFTVTNTSDVINLGPGQFRVYGNKPSTLKTDSFQVSEGISLYPNPSADYFSINSNTRQVEIYSVTGQLVKGFKLHSKEYQFNVSDLNSGIYMVKATDDNNNVKTMKLVKQ